MDLAFSTNAYTEYALEEAVRRIADRGYDGVELLGDRPHAYFPEFDATDRQSVTAALEETGLTVSNVNANTAMGYYEDAPPSAFFDPTLIAADETDRSWRVDYTKEAIDLADEVGAPAVCVATGRPLPGTPPVEAREHLDRSLSEILEHAERRGVSVGVEFEPELLVECTAEALDLVEEVGHASLGINLDVGHAAVYGEDPAEAIRRSAGHITGVHVEDIPGGRRGKHYHLVPGEGDLEFRPIFDALDDVGYDGHVTAELYTYPDEPDAAAGRAYEELSAYL